VSYLAIGAVTRALVALLGSKLNRPPLLGANTTIRVTTLPPDDDRASADTGVNLYLYRITENPFLKNEPWPGGRTGNGASPRPALALTLHYIVTAFSKRVENGIDDDIIAHQVLGNAMSILHDYPVVNDVHDAEFDADLDTQFAPELRDSFEKVKVSQVALTLDEFSKIWTGLSKAYRLSVAYEVSLAQIAPLAPIRGPAPRVQTPRVRVATMGSPMIAAVSPDTGPPGTEVTLAGTRLRDEDGPPPEIVFGGTPIPVEDVTVAESNRVVFRVPSLVPVGPRTTVVVRVRETASNALDFVVAPWIRSLTPLRGPTGTRVSITFDVPPGAQVSAEIDGVAAGATVNGPQRTVEAVVPETPTNGLKPVVLVVDDGTPRRTNALLFEVYPTATRYTAVVTAGAPPAITVTVTVDGLRLRGQQVHVRYGRLTARVAPAAVTPTRVTAIFNRDLAPAEPVAVIVDARESNALMRRLDRVEPPQAAPGAVVTLTGTMLDGAAVDVVFGAAPPVNVGAQPNPAQLGVAVPAGLAAGDTVVRVVVDGTPTNALPFRVL
jgi:Pvc16 N-terminal domain/IPT/TIG domain